MQDRRDLATDMFISSPFVITNLSLSHNNHAVLLPYYTNVTGVLHVSKLS